jgi:hypothetical protein
MCLSSHHGYNKVRFILVNSVVVAHFSKVLYRFINLSQYCRVFHTFTTAMPFTGPTSHPADYVCLRRLRPLVRPPPPPSGLRDRLRSLGLWAPSRPRGWGQHVRQLVRRGHSAGVRRRPFASVAPIPTSTSTSTSRDAVTHPPALLLSSLVFGLLNIRSLASKIDDLLEVRSDRSISVCGLD